MRDEQTRTPINNDKSMQKRIMARAEETRVINLAGACTGTNTSSLSAADASRVLLPGHCRERFASYRWVCKGSRTLHRDSCRRLPKSDVRQKSLYILTV